MREGSRFRFWLWLIALIGVIVPRRLRADWRQEWEAELRYREMLLEEWGQLDRRTRIDLFRHSFGAFRDAMWLQTYRWEDEMIQDLRYGVRLLGRHKSFTFVAVFTLALGIGANTAIFSLVNALLIRPLPYPAPERLVWVTERLPHESRFVPGAHFLDWSAHSRTLEGIAAYGDEAATLTGVGEPERLEGYRVSESFFRLLGAPLVAGRNFLSEEDRAGGERAIILSHSLWQRRFGGDREVIGRSILLDGEGYRVVGVLSESFRFFLRSDIWLPLALDYQQEHGNRQITMLQAFARLKPGVTLAEAVAEMETIKASYEGAEQKKGLFFQGSVELMELKEHLVGKKRRLLFVLLGAVALILLIACANVANLLLSRAVGRQKELAIRAALGAGRIRLLRQMLVESLLLAAGGGTGGLLLAYWLTRLLLALSPPEAFAEAARLSTIAIDARVLGFTLLVSLVSAVVFGLAPALHSSRPDLNTSLKEGGGTLFQRQRTRRALLIAEVALAVVLLAGAGLLIRSFVNLLNVEPGFETENLLTGRIALPYPRYQDRVRRAEFQRQLLERIRALPGVSSVGAINHLPLTDFSFSVWLHVEGRPASEGKNRAGTPLGLVNADYFRAMGIPLRAGRYFDERDTELSQRVIILSESLARQLFPGEEALGKRVWVPGPGQGTPVVVGVVGDVRHEGLEMEAKPQVYVPYQQNPPGRLMLAIRSTVAPESLAAAVRSEVLALDPDQPLHEVMTMEERLAETIAPRRFTLLLVGIFALMALLLSAVGVYGVISYIVSQRAHEVGVRIALGAQGRDVLRLIVRQGMALVFWGMVMGMIGALILTRAISSLLFGVSAGDPLTFTGAALLLALSALAACYLPARRAARVDPMVALRHD